jgi:hypothetical protein
MTDHPPALSPDEFNSLLEVSKGDAQGEIPRLHWERWLGEVSAGYERGRPPMRPYFCHPPTPRAQIKLARKRSIQSKAGRYPPQPQRGNC